MRISTPYNYHSYGVVGLVVNGLVIVLIKISWAAYSTPLFTRIGIIVMSEEAYGSLIVLADKDALQGQLRSPLAISQRTVTSCLFTLYRYTESAAI